MADEGTLETPDVLDQEVTLKINGEERTMSVSDAIVLAQKNASADEALREANELARSHKHAIELGQSLQAATRGDRDALINMFVGVGHERDSVEGVVDQVLKNFNGGGDSGNTGVSRPSTEGTPLDANTQAAIKNANEFISALVASGVSPADAGKILAGGIHGQAATNRVTRIKQAVSSHPKLKELYGSTPDKVSDLADAMIGKIQGGGELTDDVIQRGLNATHAALSALPGRSPTAGDIPFGSYPTSTHQDSARDSAVTMPNINKTSEHGDAMNKLLRDIASDLNASSGARAVG